VFSIKKQLFLIGKHFSFLKTGGQAIEGGGFVGSWREVAGMTVRKRTTLVVVCGFGALRYMFFVTCPAGDCLCGSPPLWAIVFVGAHPCGRLPLGNWGQIPIVFCACLSALVARLRAFVGFFSVKTKAWGQFCFE
jgi:hypothetical protein